MAAAMDVDVPSSPLTVPTPHTKRLEGTLVAPRKKQFVPNHITDTKLFGRPSSSKGDLQIQPSVVHFCGFRIGSVYRQTIRIINSSRVNQPMHIIPPTKDIFKIKYSKKMSSLVPGLSLTVTVEFRPTEWQHYTDCIRIHCKSEQNLLIPIHGYLVANLSSFPRNLNFPPTPIGQTSTKCISLKSEVPVDFQYSLTYAKAHSALSVDPLSGSIPQNGEIKLKITFSPTEFQTATMELQLEVSQYDFVPLVCSITGTSAPGLSLEQIKQELIQYSQQRPPSVHSPVSSIQTLQQSAVQSSHLSSTSQQDKLTSSSLQSLRVSHIKHHHSNTQSLASTSKHSRHASIPQSLRESSSHSPPLAEASNPPMSHSASTRFSSLNQDSSCSTQPLEGWDITDAGKKINSGSAVKRSAGNTGINMVDGFVVPDNLNTHSAVRKLLLQEPGKLRASQLRKAVDEGDATMGGGTSRQIKEVGFLKDIEQGASEEKASLFKWETRVGGSIPSTEEERTLKELRRTANVIYKKTKTVSGDSNSTYASILPGKIKRQANQVPEGPLPSFDLSETNEWASRFFVLQRFVQAAKKLIVRSRAQSCLDVLARLKCLVAAGKSVEEAIDIMYPKESTLKQVDFHLSTSQINCLRLAFPKFKGQTPVEKQNVFKSNIDPSPVVNKDMTLPDLNQDLSHLDLEVLQQSELMGYGELLTPKVSSYIRTGFYKPFLTGAEGEMESIGHIPGVDPAFLDPDPFSSTSVATTSEEESSSALRSELASHSPEHVLAPPPGPTATTSPRPEVSKRSSSFSSLEGRKPNQDAKLFKWKTMPAIEVPEMVEDVEGLHAAPECEVTSDNKPITIPASMLELPLPSAIQILDPSPEVVDYFYILPNSEADVDHALLPLPLFQSSKHPAIRLDPVDVIPGLMTWKKFLSPCLSSLEKKKRLSSCWKPSRTDPFTTAGLLPAETPFNVAMMTGPNQEDKTGGSHPISMENIQSMFSIPESEEMKDDAKKQWSSILEEGLGELEDHHYKSFNTLGDAIRSRLDAFLDLNTEGDL